MMNHNRVAAAAILILTLTCAASKVQAGTLYVSQVDDFTFATRIEKYDTMTHVGTTFASMPYKNIRSLAFDKSGNLYAPNFDNNTIERFTPGGVANVFAVPGTGLSGPWGLAFGTSGNLFVSNANSGVIEQFTPGGVGSVFAHLPSGSRPTGIAFDKSGNLYVADSNLGTIDKFTPGGVGSIFANTGRGLNVPLDLAFDGAGNLYASIISGNMIERFTPGGVGSVFARTGGPEALVFDAAGNLFVANDDTSRNNRITEFTPGGVGSVFVSTGTVSNGAMAFGPTAVPEPGSLTLLGIGLATIGGMAWMKRRTAKVVAGEGSSEV